MINHHYYYSDHFIIDIIIHGYMILCLNHIIDIDHILLYYQFIYTHITLYYRYYLYLYYKLCYISFII